MSVVLNVIIILGIVIAGSFLLFFVGDFIINAVENKKGNNSNNAKTEVYNSSVYVTDYIGEEEKVASNEEVKEEENDAEDEEEKRIAEARAALERRKAEILKRMQAQIEEDEEEEEETPAVEEEEVQEEPVAEEVVEETTEEAQEEVEEIQEEVEELEEDEDEMPEVGLINTDEEIAEEIFEEEEETEQVDTIALQAEIEQLKNQLGVERQKYDALAKELEEKTNVEPIVVETQGETLGSKEDYEAQLEEKLARLKVVEKEYKQCKKDFLPLYRVHNTLAKDEKKLHRREAIVAKQKVVLYGVNNYADIDEEKAKKLAEDLDLLDGLKLSVNHCKEVMAQNKERYPILERLYNTLKTQVETLKEEIEDIKTILSRFEETPAEVDAEAPVEE